MGRPSDWWVLDLDGDPTPGDPLRVRELARAFSSLSADAFEAAGEVRRQAGEGGVTGWLGEAGAVFGEAIGEFPGQLDKLDTSYGMVGRALTTYAGDLETAQTQADAALARGREAHGRLRAAQGQAAGAETDEQTARTALSTASGVRPLTDVPASWASAPPPGVDPTQVRTHTDAAGRLSGLRTQASDAQSDVDAERALAVAAKTLRETAASTCRGEIDRASDAGIHNRSFWDKARDFVADAWDVLVKLANIVIVVAAIAALVLGGPILWTLVVVAAAVVLADTLMKYADGEASLWDVGFALLNFVPGGKALSLGAGLARGASRLRALGGALRGGWGTARNMASGLRTGARTMAARVFCGDPVDVVTGQVMLSQTDIDLPGLLPLVLERTHLSTYRHGRHFGPTWASTLDQRLELDHEGACLPLADGTILTYPPPPADGTPVLPVEGVRWPLATDPDGHSYRVTDPQTGRTLHFPPAGAAVDLTAGQVAVLPLTAVTDRNDQRLDIDRDPDGIPTAVRHSGGYLLVVDTTDGQVTGLGLVSGDHDHNHDHADRRSEPLALARFGYDADARLAHVIHSSDLPQRFRYDNHGRLAGWTDRNNTSYAYNYDETGRCVRTAGSDGYLSGTFVYDLATRTTVATDSLGHRSTFVHNDLGQVITETDPLGNVTTSSWDRYDRLLNRTDPLGRTVRHAFDWAGNTLTMVRPDGATAHAVYDEHSRPTTVVDPDGACWEHGYDDRGNLIWVVNPAGAATTFTYDPDRPGHLTAVTDALGHRTRLETNATGYPTRFVEPSGAATGYEYGRTGRVETVTDPLGGRTKYSWTPEGRLAARSSPDGTTESWTYDGEGNLVAHVDAAGQTTRAEIGDFDLQSARTGPDGARHEFRYDTELRLTSVTNPLGLIWTYTYDPAGRLVAETDFNGRTLTYAYDAAGQLIRRTNGAGQVVGYTRDILGGVVEQRGSDGAVSTFVRDRAGRVLRATNRDADCVFTRDALGRVVAESINNRTVTSEYDVLGQRTHRITPAGTDSRWEWTADGLPAALHTAGHTMTFTHDLAGRQTERRLDSGLSLAQTWDSSHRLESQTAAHPHRSSRRREYTYSPDGFLTAVRDPQVGLHQYTLDRARHVTAVTGIDWQETYSYDLAGNIVEARWPGSAADAQGERVYAGTLTRQAGRTRYEHDAQGRVTLRQQKRLSSRPRTWRYLWNADDRLTGVVTPDGQRWRYCYDAFGRRIAKQREEFDGSRVEIVEFSWDGPFLAEQTSLAADGSSWVTCWDWEPDRLVPLTQLEHRRDPAPAPGSLPENHYQAWIDQKFHAIVADLVGAPAELLDPDGNTAWQHRTTLWGAPAGNRQNLLDCPLRFPGQYHDPETETNYNFNRYYDPGLGRYQSADPVGLTGGSDGSRYVPNPTAWIDPLGLKLCRLPPRLETGNLKEGWIHIEGRHITGTIPSPHHTDMFPASTTRAQIDDLAALLVRRGTRVSMPAQRLQTFETRTNVNGLRARYRLIVDSEDGNRVITVFPVGRSA